MEGKNYFVKYSTTRIDMLWVFPHFEWFANEDEATAWIIEQKRNCKQFHVIERKYDDLYVAMSHAGDALRVLDDKCYHPQSTDAAIVHARYEWR